MKTNHTKPIHESAPGIRRLMLPAILFVLLMPPAPAQAQFTYSTNYNGTLNVTGYTGTNPVVTIPSSDYGIVVTSVGFSAFAGRPFLTSVTIPDSIVRIVGGTFDNDTSLTNITIGGGVTNIGDDTFAACYSLPSVTLPDSVISLGNEAFDSCYKLTSVTLPNRLSSIGDSAFSYRSSLTNITIPSSVTNIGNSAFYACPALTSVYFQGNAPGVGSNVFRRDNRVTVYYLAGTTGWAAFATATGLTPVLWQPPVQLSIADFGVKSNQFAFTINGAGNLGVVIEACTDLAHPNWVPMATNNLTGGSSNFSDPQWKNHPVRFYRIQSQ